MKAEEEKEKAFCREQKRDDVKGYNVAVVCGCMTTAMLSTLD